MKELERRVEKIEEKCNVTPARELTPEELTKLSDRFFPFPDGGKPPLPPTDEEREKIREFIRGLDIHRDGEER